MSKRALYVTPCAAARKAAAAGLEARRRAPASKKGGLTTREAGAMGIGSGVARARDIVEGQRVDARRVKAFFDRHQTNYLRAKSRGLRPEESRAIQAWLLWGGDPMYRQATRAVERDREAGLSESTRLRRALRDAAEGR